MWQAGRHQESVFTLEVPGNEFPHTTLICLINLRTCSPDDGGTYSKHSKENFSYAQHCLHSSLCTAEVGKQHPLSCEHPSLAAAALLHIF